MFHATGTLYKAAGVLLEGRPNEALPLLTRGLKRTGPPARVSLYPTISASSVTLIFKRTT